MAAHVIALRFRDTTPGVDTIAAHLELLDRHQAVWWGWWRKETEELSAQDVPRGPFDVILTDRSTFRMFSGKCERFSARGVEVEAQLVPEYYRDHIGQIEGFFRLTSIKEVSYDRQVADSLGERTLIKLGQPAIPVTEHVASNAEAIGRSSVLHLSDLHFGDDYGFVVQGQKPEIGDTRRTLTECVVEDLARLGLQHDVAAVVVTGDFITKGDWNDRVRGAALREFDALRRELDLKRLC